jgi:hypothetical protein
MAEDISGILSRWQYEEDETLQVRRIASRSGMKIQIRIDLGLLQLEATGRPDGKRPYGCESLLDYYREQAERHRRKFGWYEGFELDATACAALRQESLQYYHRRISYMALQDYEAAMEDADHNLEVLDLLKAFAENREDWLVQEQYRPFILCHRTQCEALRHLMQEDAPGALLAVERGVRTLREVFQEQDRDEDFEDSAELELLDDLKRKVQGRYQVGHRQRLQILLDDALRREEPDIAAELRSQLRQLDAD